MRTRLGILALCIALCPLAAHAQDEPTDDEDVAAEDEAVAEPDPDADAIVAEPVVEPVQEPVEEPTPAPRREPPDTSIADQLRQREAVRPFHVAFGTATGIATYATTILGFLTFNDRYGWTGNGADSGCGTGSPIFGMEACNSPPYTHMISALTASTLFTVTFTLALFMPDPLGIDQGGGEQATLLTIHKALRWGLLGLFVTQLALGFVTASVNDYGTQRDLAIAHLTIGTVTNLAMTTQGILGSIMEW